MSFTLQSQDVLSTVINVLASCSLPVEHMKGLTAASSTSKSSPEAGLFFYRPIKWDKSYYSFTGFRDPEEELQQARAVEPTLRLVWSSVLGQDCSTRSGDTVMRWIVHIWPGQVHLWSRK